MTAKDYVTPYLERPKRTEAEVLALYARGKCVCRWCGAKKLALNGLCGKCSRFSNVNIPTEQAAIDDLLENHPRDKEQK